MMGDVLKFGHKTFTKVFRVECNHDHLEYNFRSRMVSCRDCGAHVDGFTAFSVLLEYWERIENSLKLRMQEMDELEQKSEKRLLKATLEVDSAWRSKTMVPTCPHCNASIFPEDGLGKSLTNKEIEIEKRRFKK